MATGVSTVDCHKQVQSWRLLRSLMQLLIPTCSNCATINNLEHPEDVITSQEKGLKNSSKYSSSSVTTTTITGTIFGYRRGKVSFCIQANANSTNPILLLELSVPTSTLAREMRGGTLRIALESRSSSSSNNNNNNGGSCSSSSSSASSLLSTPLWTMYCNGKKVGYAVKRKPSNTDVEALRLMRSVVVGTGVMRCKEEGEDDDDEDQILYLRANFQRVRGSSECESFHLIDPEGDNVDDQELSIFFFRSR